MLTMLVLCLLCLHYAYYAYLQPPCFQSKLKEKIFCLAQLSKVQFFKVIFFDVALLDIAVISRTRGYDGGSHALAY